MKYVVDAREMKQYEETVIDSVGIPSLVLQERAAMAVVEEIRSYAGNRGLQTAEKRSWWWWAAAIMARTAWRLPESCLWRDGR